MARTVNAEAQNSGEFDLDLRIAEDTDVLAGLVHNTDGGCGATCGNSCVSSGGIV
ncbi:FxLD family lanthipeptide [Kitasatospora sp. NBC_00070]|uniref:FxLD family lanthipeptide n=1 Tax=Kitasatospora sp. NBC_00070 TaxID=2975962 RepID=UPI003249BC85